MDMSFNSRMEAYYQKFIELQEKLRNSEEQRLKLEMKFGEMMQVVREEEQAHYRKLRSQYKQFLEEDRKRQERNERIIRTLERIEARVGTLASKTERFGMLRRQYQSYLQRISRLKSAEKREDPPPKIIVDTPSDQQNVSEYSKSLKDKEELKNALGKSNDEKIEILDKYLQNLSSQKCRDIINNKGKDHQDHQADLKYLDDVSKKFEDSFNSNQANSIAEDIMNSIYSRHYKKDMGKDESRATNKFAPLNYFNSDISQFGDPDKNHFTSSKLNNDEAFGKILPHPPLHLNSEIAGKQLESGEFNKNDKLDTDFGGISFNKPNEYFPNSSYLDSVTSNDAFTKTRPISSNLGKSLVIGKDFGNTQLNKNPPVYSNDSAAPKSSSDKNKYGIRNDIPNSPLSTYDSDNTAATTKEALLDPSFKQDNYSTKANPLVKDKDYQNFEKSDKYNPSVGPSKTELDSLENEKQNNANSEIKNRSDTADNFANKNVEEPKEIPANIQLATNSKTEEDTENSLANSKQDNNISEKTDAILKTDEDNSKEEYCDNVGEDLNNENVTNNDTTIAETVAPDQQRSEKEFDSTNQKDGLRLDETEQPIQKHNKSEVYDEGLGQNLQPDNANVGFNEYDQQIQYDEYGQPIQYDQYGNQIAYDNSGQPMQSQYENFQQYDQNTQPYDQTGQYNRSEQQYDEHPYEMQYDANGQAIQQLYDENGQVIQQYGQTEQLGTSYDQSTIHYGENGQLMPQYDQNGQLIQHYDTDGQGIRYNQPQQAAQYDENGVLLQQYNEHGQPTELYGQNEAPDQEYQQYDANGRFPQFDRNMQQQYDQYDNSNQLPQQQYESNQPLQHYSENDQTFQQYDENGQPINQYVEGSQLPQQYQQYSENDQSYQQYDENGQPVSQYQESGQAGQEYDQTGQLYEQYDDSGQPLKHYAESDQPIQQYETNATGQPYQQYDESGQPLNYYEGDQQFQHYSDTDHQACQQYDDNGQPINQYEETGQPPQQYSDTGQSLQQYDKSDQPVQDNVGSDDAVKRSDDCFEKQVDNAENHQEPEQSTDNPKEMPSDKPGEGELKSAIKDDGKAESVVNDDKNQPPKEKNVLDMLDTDTESLKQNTSKTSNGSDFDFSNS